MSQKLIRGWSGVFSASMLMVFGCAPLATGSESTVAMETEAATEAQARSELAVAEPAAPKQPAAMQEMASHEDEAQARASGPASLTVPGLTLLSGAVIGSSSDPYWTLHTGSGTRTWTTFVSFASGSYSSTPAVSVSLSQFNMLGNTTNSYLRVTTEDASVSGFTLRFTTEGDAIVSSATARWIAYGRN